MADEPTSALDQSKEFSVATVVVTHDHGLVQYADQQVTLSDGAVV